ncbi:unnamed protein product [Lactuca saligna]|uniref:Uncharacterized protein n=1 Tax=Lactuca saligna TaxID=75948 RepID=A0AA35Z1E5_LACSI|nr:unnamed protein product [Lactuca saligna]
MQMQVMIVPTPSQPEMSGRVEAEVDPQMHIGVVDILDDEAITDQPILYTGDESETDDNEGFLDVGFMQQLVVPIVPLNVVYLGSYSEGAIPQEVPQGTDSDIDSENDQLNPRKRKASFSGGSNVTEAGSSSSVDAGDESANIGYTEWRQIQEIIDLHNGIHAHELKLAISKLLNKVKKLHLVLSAGPSTPSSSGRTYAPRESYNTKFLLPYVTWYINNELPGDVEPVRYMLIPEPEHGILYHDS